MTGNPKKITMIKSSQEIVHRRKYEPSQTPDQKTHPEHENKHQTTGDHHSKGVSQNPSGNIQKDCLQS